MFTYAKGWREAGLSIQTHVIHALPYFFSTIYIYTPGITDFRIRQQYIPQEK